MEKIQGMDKKKVEIYYLLSKDIKIFIQLKKIKKVLEKNTSLTKIIIELVIVTCQTYAIILYKIYINYTNIINQLVAI